jgi:hypothetical protein
MWRELRNNWGWKFWWNLSEILGLKGKWTCVGVDVKNDSSMWTIKNHRFNLKFKWSINGNSNGVAGWSINIWMEYQQLNGVPAEWNINPISQLILRIRLAMTQTKDTKDKMNVCMSSHRLSSIKLRLFYWQIRFSKYECWIHQFSKFISHSTSDSPSTLLPLTND